MAYTTIDDPSAYFKVKLYTGNSSTNAITFDDTDTDMQPDMVYIKQRSHAGHESAIFDAVRGTSKDITPNSTAVEGSQSGVTAFGSDGFTLGSANDFNYNTYTYVAWCWKANGSGAANTAGSINTTKTSANTTSGISINTYSGTGSNATIGHGLGVAPTVVLCKNMGSSGDWWNWNCFSAAALGNTGRIYFNSAGSNSAATQAWNSTAPTSTLVSLGTNGEVNGSSMILYAFAPIQGFSKFGQYEGSGSTTDNTFVYLGFKPAMIIVKAIDTANQWNMFDNKRNTGNPMDKRLFADSTDAETTYASFDFLSNGFKVRNTSVGIGTADTFAYMAWAEAPFVNSNGVPCTAR